MESETKNYQLISGVFAPEKANEILMTLIQDKINFHQRNDLSQRERFGESDVAGAKRVVELTQTRNDLATLIKEAGSSGQSLEINCIIEVTMSHAEEQVVLAN